MDRERDKFNQTSSKTCYNQHNKLAYPNKPVLHLASRISNGKYKLKPFLSSHSLIDRTHIIIPELLTQDEDWKSKEIEKLIVKQDIVVCISHTPLICKINTSVWKTTFRITHTNITQLTRACISDWKLNWSSDQFSRNVRPSDH